MASDIPPSAVHNPFTERRKLHRKPVSPGWKNEMGKNCSIVGKDACIKTRFVVASWEVEAGAK